MTHNFLVRAGAGLTAAVAATLALAAPADASAPPAAAVPASPVTTAAVKAPPRNDGLNEPIYWVHGIRREKNPSFPCGEWGPAINRYRTLGAKGPQHTVAFYAKDRGCNTRIGSLTSDKSTGIKELGRRLAWDVYNRYTKRAVSVDAVGHSMGGLIIRAAITGVQKRTAGFPPRLYVEDVVTLSAPHTGAGWARLCTGSQCADLRPGSAFLRWLSSNPQSTQSTDWTLIGTADDDTVNWKSAVSFTKSTGWMSAGHKVVFYSGQKLEHSTVYKATTGHYRSRYWNFYQGSWKEQARGASPIVVARNANYFWRLW
jgi:triacylglycerol esterase/lipase EstA (alpha/beta hydrolase family)